MENIRAVKSICKKHGIPLYIDACRFAENGVLHQAARAGATRKTLRARLRATMFSHADGCTMSAKRMGLANIGGFVHQRRYAGCSSRKTC